MHSRYSKRSTKYEIRYLQKLELLKVKVGVTQSKVISSGHILDNLLLGTVLIIYIDEYEQLFEENRTGQPVLAWGSQCIEQSGAASASSASAWGSQCLGQPELAWGSQRLPGDSSRAFLKLI